MTSSLRCWFTWTSFPTEEKYIPLTVNFLVAVVNSFNTKTHSPKEMTEFCLENADVTSINFVVAQRRWKTHCHFFSQNVGSGNRTQVCRAREGALPLGQRGGRARGPGNVLSPPGTQARLRDLVQAVASVSALHAMYICDPTPRNESQCAKPTFAVARNLLQGCGNEAL